MGQLGTRGEGADSLLMEAMRASHHLACVHGPDVGAVVPLTPGSGIVVGREGSPPLCDPRASRTHARVSGVESEDPPHGGDRVAVGRVRDLSSTNGVRIRRRATLVPPSRRLSPGGEAFLCEGDVLLLGGDVFEVRTRPREATWDPPPPARRRSRMRGLFALPALLVMSSLLWRSAGSLPHWVWMVLVALLLGLLAWLLVEWGTSRRRRVDAAGLALVTRTSGKRGPNTVEAVWVAAPGGRQGGRRLQGRRPVQPGRDGGGRGARASPRRGARVESTLRIRMPTDRARDPLEADPLLPAAGVPGPGVTAPAALGPSAQLTARWWVTQLAVHCGGATVTCEDGEVRAIGEGGLRVHLVTGEQCGACTGGAPEAVLHIGVGASLREVPTWCDRIVACADPPTSWTWWDQVALPPGRDLMALPAVVHARDLDPGRGERPSGLATPIGVGAQGAVWIDLVEDGPHALVAGTTGSGKSEALTTWLLGMCRRHPAEELRLVLLDYKGGATFAPLARLPHCDRVLTDLDTADTERALRGIAALLRSRERLLGDLRLPDWARWRRAHDAGEAPAPPPRVVIALDEFRVLADAHPAMMDSLVRLAAQGRSLGLHLVLATQRPAGAVSAAMRANIEVRVALRCADDADSLDVIGSVAAARIPRIPGRALLRDGREFQVAWVGDVEGAVEQIRALRTPSSAGAPAPLWAPPLPEVVSWEEVRSLPVPGSNFRRSSEPVLEMPVLGMVDGIDTGAHAAWPWDGGHVLLEGSPRDATVLSRATLSLGRRIAGHLGRPLHVCSSAGRLPGHRSTWISPRDASSCAHLLDEVTAGGPAVVVVDDLNTLMDALTSTVGPVAAGTLLTRLLAGADTAGVVLVVSAPAPHLLPGSLPGAFAQRLVRIHCAEDAMRRGLPAGTPHTPMPGRFVAPGESDGVQTVQVPLADPATPTATPPKSRWWVEPLPVVPTPSSDTDPPRPTGTVPKPGVAPVLRGGARLLPLRCARPAPWVVIGIDEGVARAALEDLHRREGWRRDPECVVPTAGRWAELLTRDGHNVLSFGTPPDLLRALCARALTVDASARVPPTSAQVGVVLADGHLQRVILAEATPGASDGTTRSEVL